MTIADPRTALNELLTAVTALRLPAAVDPATPLAFEKVKIFDLGDLLVAMEELFIYGNRIALIGLSVIEHDTTIAGRDLRLSRALSVSIIISDRRFSDRQKAMMGDATTPGALLLQTLLVDALAGELPCGAVVEPGAGRLVLVENEKRKDLTGRLSLAQDFTVSTDWQHTRLSRTAKISATN